MRHVAMTILATMMATGGAAARGETTRSPHWVGRRYTYDSTTVREGNAVRTTGQIANTGGVVRKYDGSTVRQGNTATHHHEVTNGRGRTLHTNETTVTRVDRNTLRRDTTVTGRNDGKLDVDVTHTRDGSAVNTVKTASITTADGKTHTLNYTGRVARQGKTITRDGAWTNGQGKTIGTVDASLTRDGNRTTYHKTLANGRGETVRTNDTTVTRVDRNTLRRDTTIAGRNGRKADVNATHTRAGNAVNTDKTASITTADGKTHVLNYAGRVAWADKTITRNGTWTNGQGKTLGTVDASHARDGNKATYHKEIRNGAGQTVRRRDQTTVRAGNTLTRKGTLETRLYDKTYSGRTVRNGNTVTRSGSATVRPRSEKTPPAKVRPPWLPKYRSAQDIFGNRPRPNRPTVSSPPRPAPIIPPWRRSGMSSGWSAGRPRPKTPKLKFPKPRKK